MSTLAGVWRIAATMVAVAVVDGKKKFQNSLMKASKSDLNLLQQEALVPEHWHGNLSGVSFGWQEGADGVYSSRDNG
jgi:hypothetical protein